MTGLELVVCLGLLSLGGWLVRAPFTSGDPEVDIVRSVKHVRGFGALVSLGAAVWLAVLVVAAIPQIDAQAIPWTARLILLAVIVAVGWLLLAAAVFPDRRRNSVSLREYTAAFRSAGWFGWQPGPLLIGLVRFAVICLALVYAFPELFKLS